MMDNVRRCFALCSALLTLLVGAGCAAKLKVTYFTDPSGATVYAGGSPLGYSPVTLEYATSVGFRDGRECMNLSQVSVRWASGAEASVPGFRACPQNGEKQAFNFARPVGLEGRDLDILFGIEVQRARLAARQANDAMLLQILQSNQATIDAARAARARVRCTSNIQGNTVYTTCG